MSVVAITFGAGRSKRYLGANTPGTGRGWHPYRWVRDQELAELFSSEKRARDFAAAELGHDQFNITVIVPRSPSPNTGPGRPILNTAFG